MRIGIVQFPGSNCERETGLALLRAGMEPYDLFWHASAAEIASCAGFVIAGGFSFEDRARAGAIAARDPLMHNLRAESERGKPVLGICNGAQILVESGMVPGFQGYPVSLALAENLRIREGILQGAGYYNAWVNLVCGVRHPNGAFTRRLAEGDMLRVPLAHAEGRFVMDPGTLATLQTSAMTAFRYADASGEPTAASNPNGSMDNLAALTNHAGNVLAIMPHPERTEAGDVIFQSMREYIKAGYAPIPVPPVFPGQDTAPPTWRTVPGSTEWLIALVITDNHAMSVEQALRQQGIAVSVRRLVHWEIGTSDLRLLRQITESGVLYNPHKEFRVESPAKGFRMLVRAREDVSGMQKARQLQQVDPRFADMALRHGIVWEIVPDQGIERENALEAVRRSGLLWNRFSHEGYVYAGLPSENTRGTVALSG